MGARSQTICFCSFTVLVFYGVSVASVQKQTKGGGGGGGRLPLIRHCVQRNIPWLGNKFSKQFFFEHILLKSSQKLVEHNGHFAQAMSI